MSLAIIIFTTVSISTCTQELPFYRETQQFKIVCLPTECDAADEILEESEKFFAQLSENLQHDYSTQITVKIYPDLHTFHYAINYPNASDWVVGELQEHAYAIVTPCNPGPAHSYDSIIKANNTNLAELFIIDKYPHTNIPRWLHQGTALYFANYFSDASVEKFINTVEILPSLEQLENIDKEDNQGFAELDGFIVSYLLVRFIDTQWNRATLLALLDNYADFENILGFLKKSVEIHWSQSILLKTHVLESGNPSLYLPTKDLLSTLKKAISATYKKYTCELEPQIVSAFDTSIEKFTHSNNQLLAIIQTNTTIAGWALFSIEPQHRATLEIVCINPDYRRQDIGKKLIASIHKKFPTIASIAASTRKMNVKTPCFCGTLDFEKKVITSNQ